MQKIVNFRQNANRYVYKQTNFEQKRMLFACLTVFCNAILIER